MKCNPATWGLLSIIIIIIIIIIILLVVFGTQQLLLIEAKNYQLFFKKIYDFQCPIKSCF